MLNQRALLFTIPTCPPFVSFSLLQPLLGNLYIGSSLQRIIGETLMSELWVLH